MKQKIINFVKYHPFVYRCYAFFGSMGINILKLFVKRDEKAIIFVAFGGKKYDDSPKAVYEAMLSDHRFDDYRLIWAFVNPEKHEIPRGEKVKIDTLNYYKKLLASRVWITNSSVGRGLSFSVEGTFYINTWHGIPIKKIGEDTPKGNKAFGVNEDYTDFYFSSSTYDNEILCRAFALPKEKVINIGMPRNDELYKNNTVATRNEIKKKLGIDQNKITILYAPTFREFAKDENSNITMIPPMNLKKWEKELGKDYVLLFRAHYEVSKLMEIKDNEFVKNMTSYPNLNELMLASDILLSDYSSIYFDYSILKRPMFCFCYDYDEYAAKRGVYIDIREELQSNLINEDEVIAAIKCIDEEKRISIAQEFFKKYMPESGDSCVKTLNLIYDNITKN